MNQSIITAHQGYATALHKVSRLTERLSRLLAAYITTSKPNPSLQASRTLMAPMFLYLTTPLPLWRSPTRPYCTGQHSRSKPTHCLNPRITTPPVHAQNLQTTHKFKTTFSTRTFAKYPYPLQPQTQMYTDQRRTLGRIHQVYRHSLTVFNAECCQTSANYSRQTTKNSGRNSF